MGANWDPMLLGETCCEVTGQVAVFETVLRDMLKTGLKADMNMASNG